ncbi:serine/threonine protein phosphatase [Candidatus Babeliales bacterium]|nr:serine/threonine protein phosphatase [Candidatus Babeliales bacterium]
MSRLLLSFFFIINLVSGAYAHQVTLNDLAYTIFSQQKEYDHGFSREYPQGIVECFEQEEFKRVISDLYCLLCGQMDQGGVDPDQKSFFIQKVELKKDFRLVVVGDIHGSVHALLRNLLRLKALGILSDDLKLADNHYLIFTGDYADRGRYGVEVWYLLALLKLANPDNVFLCRGNHEIKGVAEQYGFKKELIYKYDETVFCDESNSCFVTMCDLFSCLPVALLLGRDNNYVMACHGGLPLKDLNDCKCGIEFCEAEDKFKFIYPEGECPFALTDEIKAFSRGDSKFMVIDNEIGQQFLWNDFEYGCGVYVSSRGVGYEIGIDIVAGAIEAYGIKSIFRGHQHNENAVSVYKCCGGLIECRDDDLLVNFVDCEVKQVKDGEIRFIDKKLCVFMSAPEGIEKDTEGFGVVWLADEGWRLEAHSYELPEDRDGKYVLSRENDDREMEFEWFDDEIEISNALCYEVDSKFIQDFDKVTSIGACHE